MQRGNENEIHGDGPFMKTLVALVAFAAFGVSAIAQNADDESRITPQERESWNRVHETYPDIGERTSATYAFIRAQIDDIHRKDPKFFEQTNWPEILVVRYATQLQALKSVAPSASGSSASSQSVEPELAQPRLIRPYRDFIAFSHGLVGENSLTIDNGTDHCAVIKLIDSTTQAKAYSLVVRSQSRPQFGKLHDGKYRMIVAFGDVFVDGTDRFDPFLSFMEFEKPVTLVTTRNGDVVTSSDDSITLQAVPDGNTKTSTISRVEFEKW